MIIPEGWRGNDGRVGAIHAGSAAVTSRTAACVMNRITIRRLNIAFLHIKGKRESTPEGKNR